MLKKAYHSYRIFGLNNEQKSEKFRLNQLAKEPIILSYILHAIAKSKKSIVDEVSFAELFCAGAYFALAAKKFGATTSIGIDNCHKNYFDAARKVAEYFKEDLTLLEMDVADIGILPKADIVANVGGLYHTKDPKSILEKSYDYAKKFLIIQTVVTMEKTPYFESSPNDRSWGARFTKEYMDDLVSKYKVIDSHFNELEGNASKKNRGSAYYLIKK